MQRISALRGAIILPFLISTTSVDKPVTNFQTGELSHEPVSVFLVLRNFYTINISL
jgi:hypothetical protein